MKIKELIVEGYWDNYEDYHQAWDEPEDINDMDENDQLKLVLNDSDNWEAIEKPSPKLIKMFFEAEPWAICSFPEKGIPVTKEMIYNAVSRDPYVIAEYVVEQTLGTIPEELKWIALKKNPNVITHFIENPTAEMIKYALTNPILIKDKTFYNNSVNKLLKGNNLLIKKWLRYGETMRGN